MVDRRPKWLFDAIAAIRAAHGFVSGMRVDEYEANLLVRSGVERQLEVLGEACARLCREDDGLAERIPACRLAIGLRNRIIHGYDAVDDETVFRTVRDDLPELELLLQVELAAVAPPN